MRFGPTAVQDAEGAVLAHGLRVGSQIFKKGRVLSAADLKALAAAGIDSLICARLDSGDMAEDAAAAEVARALAGGESGISITAPFTGRVNLHATGPGVLRLNTELIRAANRVDEAITLATLPDFTRVEARQMLATIKIIPYAAPRVAVAQVVATLRGQGAVAVHGFRPLRAALVQTTVPTLKPSLLENGRAAVAGRLAVLGATLCHEETVPHETGALAARLSALAPMVDLVLVLAGSATSDRADVTPAAIVAAGGRVARFGMPVDPGNLLVLGYLGALPVLGLPGCARSPKLNGADWVLERLVAGLPIADSDWADMAVGGLLKEIPARPFARVGEESGAARRPHISALLLAAGQSRRMGGINKLAELVNGQPLLRHVASQLLAAQIDELVVVSGPDAAPTQAMLAGLKLRVVPNPAAAEGMGASIRAGMAALNPHTDAVLVALGDMPEVGPTLVDRLIAGFDPAEGRVLLRPVAADGRAGNPVLFGRRFFESLAALGGDEGARRLIAEHAELVTEIRVTDAAAFTDLDTPEAWAAWRARPPQA